jgi:DNA polymerase-3 subunit delta
MSAPIRLVKGSDDTIRGDAVRELTDELLGELDASLALDRVEGDDYELATAVDAAQTAPFLTDRRVVVVRHLGRFGVDELSPLLQYLADPLPTTSLILVWERGVDAKTAKLSPVPKRLTEAVTAAGGEVVDTSVGTGKARQSWLDDQLRASSVSFDRSARDLVAAHLGDDMDRVGALLTTLESAYGPGAKVDGDAVAPFLGEAGQMPPWALTDAIETSAWPSSACTACSGPAACTRCRSWPS